MPSSAVFGRVQQIKNKGSKMKKILTIIGLAAATLAGAQAQVLFSGNYTQNFNSFSSTANVTWTNNSTLTGWTITSEASESTLVVNSGATTTGQLYNYGAASGSDRALGYIGSGSNDWTNFYLQIQNNTGVALTELKVTYDGELWRSGGTQTVNSNNLFAFYYATGSPTLVDSSSTTGWTAVTNLNYAPTVNVTVGALSGTATTITTTITGLSLAQGESIYLRWFGDNGTGTDAGLAIDNVSIVPEPKTWALIGIGSAFMLWNLRRRRVQA